MYFDKHMLHTLLILPKSYSVIQIDEKKLDLLFVLCCL